MTVSRRGFMNFSKVLAAACVLPRSLFAFKFQAIKGRRDATDGIDATSFVQNMTKESIAPYVKSAWKVRSDSGNPTYLTLSAVKDITAPPVAGQQTVTFAPKQLLRLPTAVDTFILEFQGIGDALPQGTYELEHSKLGVFSLFIVPGESPTYTAVISHIVSQNSSVLPPVRSPRIVQPLMPVRIADTDQ